MTELSKNAQVPQCNKTAVMPCFYHFDINRRVYEKDGIKRNYEKDYYIALYCPITNGYSMRRR